MNAATILDGQVIHVKRGRLNGLGFEPCFNAYFDFYLDTKYFGTALLKLEDVTFHLYLRKNLNDQNPRWKMPTIRQMKKKFGVSDDRLSAMMKRLEHAHLLKKLSGVQPNSKVIRNHYLLSDPIPVLQEFLTVAQEGIFGKALKEGFQCPEIPDTSEVSVPEIRTLSVPEIRTHKQTFSEQTVKTKEEQVWASVLKGIKSQIPLNVYMSLVEDTYLIGWENGIARIVTPRAFAVDWLRDRMAPRLRKELNLELRMRDGDKACKIKEVTIEVFSSPDGSSECQEKDL